MQAFIYVSLAQPHEIPFQLPLTQWATHTIPDLTTFDFDNQSDASLSDYVLELIKRSDKLVLLIDNQQGSYAALGGLMKVMQVVTRKKHEQIRLILQGRHPAIEKMGHTLKSESFYQTKDMEESKERILSFFLV